MDKKLRFRTFPLLKTKQENVFPTWDSLQDAEQDVHFLSVTNISFIQPGLSTIEQTGIVSDKITTKFFLQNFFYINFKNLF